MDSLQQSDPAISIVQNIMFVENKQNGRFDPLIARYYPNNDSAVRDFDEIYYSNIDNTWSGVVDIWTYDERHFISFSVHYGIIQNHFFFDKGQDVNGKYISGENLLTVDCFRVPTTVSYTYTTTGYYETTVEATQNYTAICSGGGSSGGGSSGGGGGTHTYNGGGNYDGSSGSATNPMPSYTPPPIPPPVVYVIDMRGLSKCHQDLIKALIGGTQQEIRRIFDKFNGDQPVPSNYNVKFQYGDCGTGATACTSPNITNGFAVITINQSVNVNASDLSMARTIMHEMLHAYLLFERNYPSNCDLNCLLNKYIEVYGGSNLNPTHHALFVETKFIADIASELKNYASSIGYNIGTLGDQFFKDMAWGGLITTNVFKNLSIIEQNRIINTIGAELYSSNYSGVLPKGVKACD